MKLWRRRIVLIVALVLVASASWLAISHYRSKHAVNAYKRELLAAGEKLMVDELIPKLVPPEENSAATFREAVRLMGQLPGLLITNPPTPMRMAAVGKAMVFSTQPDIKSDSATNSWEELENTLVHYEDSLRLFHQITNQPVINLEWDYHVSVNYFRTSEIRRAGQLLMHVAVAELHKNRPVAGLAHLRATLALVTAFSDEPELICQMMRMLLTTFATSVTWELLQAPGITESQLADLQQAWATLKFIAPLESTTMMDRATDEERIEVLRSSRAEFRKFISGRGSTPNAPVTVSSDGWWGSTKQYAVNSWDQTRVTAKEAAWRISWSYEDQLRTLKSRQILLECLRIARTNDCFEAALQHQRESLPTAVVSEEGGNWGDPVDLDFRVLLSEPLRFLLHLVKRVAKTESTRRLVQTAIALKRYQLKNGAHPPTLAALTPEFLPAVPIDPYDCNPLRYRLNADGSYLLYSIGEDETDNGGDASGNTYTFAWQMGHDLVWPGVANTAEIEASFNRQREAVKRSPAD